VSRREISISSMGGGEKVVETFFQQFQRPFRRPAIEDAVLVLVFFASVHLLWKKYLLSHITVFVK
jgi:hypothetical protein